MADDANFRQGDVIVQRQLGADVEHLGPQLDLARLLLGVAERGGLHPSVAAERDVLASDLLPLFADPPFFEDDRRWHLGHAARLDEHGYLIVIPLEDDRAGLNALDGDVPRSLLGPRAQCDERDPLLGRKPGGFHRRLARVGLAVADQQNAGDRFAPVGERGLPAQPNRSPSIARRSKAVLRNPCPAAPLNVRRRDGRGRGDRRSIQVRLRGRRPGAAELVRDASTCGDRALRRRDAAHPPAPAPRSACQASRRPIDRELSKSTIMLEGSCSTWLKMRIGSRSINATTQRMASRSTQEQPNAWPTGGRFDAVEPPDAHRGDNDRDDPQQRAIAGWNGSPFEPPPPAGAKGVSPRPKRICSNRFIDACSSAVRRNVLYELPGLSRRTEARLSSPKSGINPPARCVLTFAGSPRLPSYPRGQTAFDHDQAQESPNGRSPELRACSAGVGLLLAQMDDLWIEFAD